MKEIDPSSDLFILTFWKDNPNSKFIQSLLVLLRENSRFYKIMPAFKVFSIFTRLWILMLLLEHDLRVCELLRQLPSSSPTILRRQKMDNREEDHG